MKKIGSIGVRIVGKSMVHNLMGTGYEVAIYTRIRSKVEDITNGEVIWRKNTGECAKGRQVVISIVGYPKNVEDVYSDESGVITNANPDTLLIDIIATGPRLVMRIYEGTRKVDPHALDAPVTGGDKGAEDGALTILAGNDREDFDICLNILQAMDRDIDYEGKAGNGQHTKICNQIAVAGAPAGTCEAMVYARNVGLDVNTVLESVSTETAGSMQMNNVVSKALQDGYRPGFFIKHFIRDMDLADEETRAADTELKVLEGVLSIYKELEREGMEELRTQALIKYYNW